MPSPLQIANVMAQAAQEKAQQPNGPSNPKAKRVAAAKEQEKAKGKKPPKTGAQAGRDTPPGPAPGALPEQGM